MTDPAGRASDQHALVEQRCAVPQRAQQVRLARGSAATAAKLTVSGSTMRCVGTAARSAEPNSSINATMRAPAGGPLPSAKTAKVPSRKMGTLAGGAS